LEDGSQVKKSRQKDIKFFARCRYSASDGREILCLAGDGHVGLCSKAFCPLKQRK
jgi:hypothetical protein